MRMFDMIGPSKEWIDQEGTKVWSVGRSGQPRTRQVDSGLQRVWSTQQKHVGREGRAGSMAANTVGEDRTNYSRRRSGVVVIITPTNTNTKEKQQSLHSPIYSLVCPNLNAHPHLMMQSFGHNQSGHNSFLLPPCSIFL